MRSPARGLRALGARALVVRLALLTVSLLAAPVALAQEEPRDARLDLADEADLLFERGVEAQQRGDFRGALERYLASQRLAPNKNVVFNIAVCFERLARWGEAFRYYSDYLALETDPGDRRLAEDALERIRSHVALLRVDTEPAGALVYLDRRDLGSRGRTPRALALEPGRHRVLVELEGYEPAESDEVEVVVGQERVVSLTLTRILGDVRVTGEPEGAEIRVDEESTDPVGVVPATVSLPPGQHTLIVSAVGHQTTRFPITVVAQGTTRLEVTLPLETGTLVVDAEERGALIELDGEAVGFTPAVLPAVPSGPHTIRILREGFRAYEDEIVIAPNQRTTVSATMRLSAEVTAASREAESIEDAPASVSLVTQEEMRAFGYQTVQDALVGQRGIYASDDRTYSSIGIRGFAQPSDYGNRLLLTMDGHTLNDDQLGSSYVGYDGRADLLDVERIELVRGAGSALYGTNAFFGVVNLVTRDRDSLLPPHASIATDGFRGGRARVGAGVRLSRDAGFWLSAGGLYAQGDDIFFREHDTLVRGADGFHTLSAAGRGWIGDFTLEIYFNRRDKRIPTGAFETVLGDPRSRSADTRGFAELRWEPRFGRELHLYVRAFADLYFFEGDYAYEAPTNVQQDRWDGTWIGGEARAVITPVEWLRITAGAETRGSLVARLVGQAEDEGRYLDTDARFLVAGGYVVANARPIQELSIDLGGRFDYVSTFADGAFSPRGALVVRPWTGGTLKLLGGGAFRAPSPYELRYNDGGTTQIAPEALAPERVWSGELEYTHRIEELSFTASVFYNRIENLITLGSTTIDDGSGPVDVFVYENSTDIAQTIGGEAEVRRDFRQGWMVAATYSFQRTRVGDLLSDTDVARLTNSPEHLFAVRGVAPLAPEVATLAARLRVESPRLGRLASGTLVETDVPILLDLILSGEIRQIHLTYAAGVRNLLDWQYGYPGGEDVLPIVFVPQPGRTFFVQTTLTF